MTSILVVDDDKDITANVADILSDLGYDADVANDGESALELAKSNRYDIALLDFKMPGMDGADLYRRIKASQPHVVAIMVTAYAGSNGVERAINAGTWKVLRKPVDIAQLMSLVDEASQQPLLLVVDDDREFCESLWQILRDKGFRVGFAFDEDSARAQLLGCDARVVLLDLQLGDQTSESFFQFLIDSQRAGSTIIVTGNREESDGLIAFMVDSGAKAVHYKPLDVAALVHTIEKSL